MTLLRKIPTTVVTGFLGAGKTTLLRQLLTQAQGRRIAVIVNEFGELGIDGELLRACGLGCDEQGRPDGSLIELANGCLCCTVQDEFLPVMEQLAQRRDTLDHLVIETSGLALPKPLVQAFQWPSLRHAFTVDAVVTVVDAPAVAAGQFAADPEAVQAQRAADEQLDHDSPLAELFEDQLAVADLVVLNKCDLLEPQALAAVEQRVQPQLRAGARIVRATQGRVELDVLLGWGRALETAIDAIRTHHDDEEDDHDHDAFNSVVLEAQVSDRERLLAALQQLVQSHPIYRVKGFVALPGAAMRWVVQAAGPRLDAWFDRPWRADEPRRTQLVLIGAGLQQGTLQQQLDAALRGA
jgi:cobalamin biosynthesis protein CobW